MKASNIGNSVTVSESLQCSASTSSKGNSREFVHLLIEKTAWRWDEKKGYAAYHDCKKQFASIGIDLKRGHILILPEGWKKEENNRLQNCRVKIYDTAGALKVTIIGKSHLQHTNRYKNYRDWMKPTFYTP